MKQSGWKFGIWLILGIIVTLLIYSYFIQSNQYPLFVKWSDSHKTELILILLIIKVVGIVWPPVPGGLITLTSIPIFGWSVAYLIDLTGSIIGSWIAYELGKHYGYEFLSKFLGHDLIQKVRKIKIKKNKEFEGILVLRFFGGTIVEVVAYSAGLLGVGIGNFLLAGFISHIIVGVPSYYFAGNIFSGQNTIISVVSFLLLLLLLTKFKNRYFE